MAKSYTIDKFLKNIPGNRDRLKDVISNIDFRGDWVKIYDVDVVLKHLIVALLIPKRTYVFDPEYGSAIYKYLFEPADTITLDALTNEVNEVVSGVSTQPGTTITHDVLFFRNKRGFRIEMTVQHKKTKRTMNVDLDDSILNLIV